MSPTVERVESDEKLPAAADAVVIGGGIIGAAAAYFFARKGLSVALLEKGHVAGEQSSRNWGWCRLSGRALPELALAVRSQAIWAGLNQSLGADTGFRQAGIMLVTRNPAEIADWEQWMAQARDYQIPGQILTAAEVKERAPATSAPWVGGWYSPTCGRAEPARAAPALAGGARAQGATIHQNCAARGLETQGGAVSAVITERGTIRTSSVLCAGGAWTSLFCRRHGIAFPQAGVLATACRTSAAPAVTEGAVGSDGFSFRRREDGGYTVALRGRGRVDLTPQGLLYARKFLPLLIKRRRDVSVGIGRSFFTGPETLARWSFDGISPFERTRVLDPSPDMKLVEQAMTSFRAAYPVLRDIKVEQAWAGLIDSSPDSLPVISQIDPLPGLHVAAGFTGHGFALGPGGGQLAADLMAGDTPGVDPLPFRYSRLVDGTKLTGTRWV